MRQRAVGTQLLESWFGKRKWVLFVASICVSFLAIPLQLALGALLVRATVLNPLLWFMLGMNAVALIIVGIYQLCERRRQTNRDDVG